MVDGQGELDVVTGAFGYSGAVIAGRLRGAGRRVRTLTGHPGRAPAGTDIEVRPLDFADRAGLTESLRGAHTLYNTYWVRFPHGGVDHEVAVANSATLLRAAADAGVRRIVQVSILHPSLDSPYAYFRGKARVEQVLADVGVPYAVVRPAVLFGGRGVLVNNIAWLLRHLPVFAVGGRGDYRVRPIHVEDLAELCVHLGTGGDGDSDTVTDAVGPQRLAFRRMVEAIRGAVGGRAVIVDVPGAVLTGLATLLGAALRDTLLTADEYHAMADGLADSDAPATGTTAFTDWVAAHGDGLGYRYANEINLHFTGDTTR